MRALHSRGQPRAGRNTPRSGPHSELSAKPSAACYARSRGPTRVTPLLEHLGHFRGEGCDRGGDLRFKHELSSTRAHALAHHRLGFEEVADGRVVDLLRDRVVRAVGRADVHDLWVTPPTKSVTHHAGLFCYPSSRLLTACESKNRHCYVLVSVTLMRKSPNDRSPTSVAPWIVNGMSRTNVSAVWSKLMIVPL